MRLGQIALITFAAVTTSYAFGAEPPSPTAPNAAPSTREAPPLHSRPYTVKCAASVSVWVEVDGNSLPAREDARAESKKRVQLHLVGSAPSRGESVVCSYATRSRDVTTSYYTRCIQPRKERGYRHSYTCK